MARRTHEEVILIKQQKKDEATKYLRSLSPAEYLKKTVKVGRAVRRITGIKYV